MHKLFRLLLGIPKSVIFNLMMFDFRTAIKLPVLLAPGVVIKAATRGIINLNEPAKPGLVTIGFWDGSGGIGKGKTFVEFKKGKFVVEGRISIASGSLIRILDGGILRIGKNFKGNAKLKLICRKEITIKDDVLFSWNCTVMDSDGHEIYDKDGKRINFDKEVIIGNNVWIGAEASILKGAKIPDNSIIGYRSLVSKELDKANCVYIFRNNCMVVAKEKISWKI